MATNLVSFKEGLLKTLELRKEISTIQLNVSHVIYSACDIKHTYDLSESLAFNLARSQKKHLNLGYIYSDILVRPDFLCSRSFDQDKRTIREALWSIMGHGMPRSNT